MDIYQQGVTYKNSLLMSLLWDIYQHRGVHIRTPYSCPCYDIYQQGVTVELLILSLYADIYPIAGT